MKNFQIRGIQFAGAYYTSVFLSREKATFLHTRICEILGFDDITFAYKRSEDSTAFSLNLTHSIANQQTQIALDRSAHNQPTKLILTFSWPNDVQEIKATTKVILEEFAKVMDCQPYPLLSELNLRTDVKFDNLSGQEFIESNFLKNPIALEGSNSSVSMSSIKLKLNPNESDAGNTKGIKSESHLIIEPLLKDPKKLYIELSTRWVKSSQTVLEESLKAESEDIQEDSLLSPTKKIDESIQFISDLLLKTLNRSAGDNNVSLRTRSKEIQSIDPDPSKRTFPKEVLS